MAARAAAVDLAKISNLGLGKNTLAQISAFRKRADDAKRQLAQLKQQNTDVDFAHYNKVLRNKDVVSQAQKILSEFKPVTYDVQAQLKAIDAFESKAVSIRPLFLRWHSIVPYAWLLALHLDQLESCPSSHCIAPHRIIAPFQHSHCSFSFSFGIGKTRPLPQHDRSTHAAIPMFHCTPFICARDAAGTNWRTALPTVMLELVLRPLMRGLF